MKIAHICLSCFYIDGFSYQENELVRQNVSDGHDVLVIASTETINPDGKIQFLDPGRYAGSDGADVIRLPYSSYLPRFLMRKFRKYKGVIQELKKFSPDVILFHGCCAQAITEVSKFTRHNPNIILYVDSHEDFNTGAKSFISREILHKIIYRYWLQKGLPQISKVLATTPERFKFVQDIYGVPEKHIELFRMGGHPMYDPEYELRCSTWRTQNNIGNNTILYCMSGKFRARRKPIETLKAFIECAGANSVLVVAGVFDSTLKESAMNLIESDSRILYVGWQDYEGLTNLLCAADIYINLGTHSSTNEHSVCCRCAVLLSSAPVNAALTEYENGLLIGQQLSIATAIKEIESANIEKMKMFSLKFALKYLDYRVLANRYLSK